MTQDISEPGIHIGIDECVPFLVQDLVAHLAIEDESYILHSGPMEPALRAFDIASIVTNGILCARYEEHGQLRRYLLGCLLRHGHTTELHERIGCPQADGESGDLIGDIGAYVLYIGGYPCKRGILAFEILRVGAVRKVIEERCFGVPSFEERDGADEEHAEPGDDGGFVGGSANNSAAHAFSVTCDIGAYDQAAHRMSKDEIRDVFSHVLLGDATHVVHIL